MGYTSVRGRSLSATVFSKRIPRTLYDGTERGGALCAFAGRQACHPHALRYLPRPDRHASTIEGRIAQTGPGERRRDRNDAGADHHVGKTKMNFSEY
jgi:hypothetical protein